MLVSLYRQDVRRYSILILLAVLITAAACGFSPDGGEIFDASPEPDASVDAPVDAAEVVPTRINLGSDLATYEGQEFPGTWLGGQSACVGMGTNMVSDNANIGGTIDDPLFRTSLFGQTVLCEFDVAASSYAITLLFAEIFFGGGSCTVAGGARNTEVVINGAVVDSFDIVALSGGCAVENPLATPFAKSYIRAPSNDGIITIELRGVDGNSPLIAAIEVVPLAD